MRSPRRAVAVAAAFALMTAGGCTGGSGAKTSTPPTSATILLTSSRATRALTLARTVWTWGDGTSTTVDRGDRIGRPHMDAVPCESATVCTRYISHVFATPGRRVVRVEVFWDVKVTLDGAGTPIPVTGGGIFRADTVGKTVTLHRARVILVNNP